MANVQPFPGIRYQPASFDGDLSSVICPPYDVLDESDKSALMAKDDRNFVQVDLPFVPPKQAGPQAVYDRAAATVGAWLKSGTLIQDGSPAFYVYHQSYRYDGTDYVRKLFLGRLGLEAFGEGCVFPHEETFGGPKEDRLKLTQATQCNMSPIFGLYPDEGNEVSAVFDVAATGKPTCRATMDGMEHRLWVVRDPEIPVKVSALMGSRSIYIADGHHRYGTAMMYKSFVESQGGTLRPAHPVNFVLTAFCGMSDAGLLILPTHRVLHSPVGITVEKLLTGWSSGIERCGGEESDLTLVDGADGSETPVRFTNRAVLNELASEKSAAWRGLDLAYLHRYLIDELMAGQGRVEPQIEYVKAEQAARDMAAQTKGVACLTRSISMAALEQVSRAGDLMPHKSTYFFPKIATGLVIHSLTE